MESRGIKAVRLVKEGRSIAFAAKEAGVSEFWLGLVMERKK
jgi:hypothetical protein